MRNPTSPDATVSMSWAMTPTRPASAERCMGVRVPCGLRVPSAAGRGLSCRFARASIPIRWRCYGSGRSRGSVVQAASLHGPRDGAGGQGDVPRSEARLGAAPRQVRERLLLRFRPAPRPDAPRLPDIEDRMRRIVRDDHLFHRRVLGTDEARKLFEDQPYKLETIDDLARGKDEYGEDRPGDGAISAYRHDTFEDLCLGPHLERTGQIPADGFKLLDVSGAYWRGSEKNPMLQRVHGTVWPDGRQLDRYLWRRGEEEKRDHRRLGAELDLFSIQPEAGPGLVLFHPNGALVRTIMEDYWRERDRAGGYDLLATPHIGKSGLWETSGHLRWYEEGMYPAVEIEDEQYYLKPMNCPFHMLIFRTRSRSYRDLPMRYAELGTVYRYEP